MTVDEELSYALTVSCPFCGRLEGQKCREFNGSDRTIAHRRRTEKGKHYRRLRAQQTRLKDEGYIGFMPPPTSEESRALEDYERATRFGKKP